MVPHHGGRMEPDGHAEFLEAPTNIDVVSGSPVEGVPTADSLKRRFANSEVTTGDMFGQIVAHQHVNRTARRFGNTLGNESVSSGRQRGAANGRMPAIAERMRQIVEPVGIG